jgi:hypothetical protein
MKNTVAVFLAVLAVLFLAMQTEAKALYFSGFEWTVRETGKGAPGNNFWHEDNVWVDENGFLHLVMRQRDGVWTCAEIKTKERFQFGKFTFEIIGRIDRLDKNVVLGLFNYPQEFGRDGSDEVDIEFAKWGKDGNNNGNYTVWANQKGVAERTHNFPFALTNDNSTHTYTRTPQNVSFQSFYGHNTKDLIYEWNFAPANPEKHISPVPMPLYLNLWLFRGNPPSDGERVEIIVRRIEFSKMSATN